MCFMRAPTLSHKLSHWVVSFDHLVGPDQERGWDREAERVGSLEIDQELEFRRLLQRQVFRFGAVQNASYILRPPMLQIGPVRSVRRETSGFREASEGADDRQAVLKR